MNTETQTPALGPYAVLAREHRLIERMLNVLDRICDETWRTKKLDASAATEVIHFSCATSPTARTISIIRAAG